MNIIESKVLYCQILQIYREYACREVNNVPNRCTDCRVSVYVLYTLHGITSPWPWWERRRSSFRLCPVFVHSPSTAYWCSDCPGTNSLSHDTETIQISKHYNSTNLMTWIKYKAWDTKIVGFNSFNSFMLWIFSWFQ